MAPVRLREVEQKIRVDQKEIEKSMQVQTGEAAGKDHTNVSSSKLVEEEEEEGAGELGPEEEESRRLGPTCTEQQASRSCLHRR